MYYDSAYEMETLIASLISGLMSSVPSLIISIATYVLTAIGLYTIAKRRGIYHAWLSWVPVLNCWVLGSISDQYHYVVKGENKSKRKVLLTLNILTNLTSIIILVICGVMIFNVVNGAINDMSGEDMAIRIMGPLSGMMGLLLPMMALSIAYTVIYYFALYDVYKSLDPSNGVLFLVLSIFFNVTTPFFLFFNRQKDGGMPPRKQDRIVDAAQPTWQSQQPTWQQSQQPTWQQPQQPQQPAWQQPQQPTWQQPQQNAEQKLLEDPAPWQPEEEPVDPEKKDYL